jgi:7-cyano-7-deazaguanine synthase
MQRSTFRFLHEINHSAPLAVLVSGGIDSAVLLANALPVCSAVHPLYLRWGLIWEVAELAYLRQYLEVIHHPALQPLQILELPVADLYGPHWSLTGRGVPDAQSPDEAVFLPGRNVLLLAKAILWCHLRRVPAVALGLLASNPFPDATHEFFETFPNVVNHAVGGAVKIYRPFASLSKTEVVKCGTELPLQYTFSCIRPVNGRHCGRCNKCAERRRAFLAAGIADPTLYEAEASCTA